MLKQGVTITTCLYAEHKMFKGLGQFYNTALSKAATFAKNNPLICPAKYTKTAAGFAFDAIEEKIGSSNLPPTFHPCTDRCNIFKPLGRGSTGRTTPKNLSDPTKGKPLYLAKGMTDPRWHQSEGWLKMRCHINGIKIHYVGQWINGILKAVDDFKFKEK